MSRVRKIVVAAVVVIALAVIGFLVYANIVYRGEREPSLEAWRSDAVEITRDGGSFVLEPTERGGDGEGLGLVFIPGAKVHPSAYLFKMSGIVEATGMTVVITDPTLNLAFFDSRPLSAFTDRIEGVDDWFVGGHSLGGVRACQLAASEDVVGLMLFGSYCIDDLSESGLAVASFVATNDGVSAPDEIAARANLLPDDTTTIVLEGSNHALFGDYGPQDGDNPATVTTDEVRTAIAEAFAEFIGTLC